MPMPSNQRGFTIIELLVVIALLGVIMAFVAPNLFTKSKQAQVDATRIQLEKVRNSIELYRLEVGKYPTTLTDLMEKPGDSARWKGPYLDKKSLLKDPWDHELVYRRPGDNAPYDLLSYGTDGQAGGEGENADISVRD